MPTKSDANNELLDNSKTKNHMTSTMNGLESQSESSDKSFSEAKAIYSPEYNPI